MTAIDDITVRAYLETEFIAHGEEQTTLTIGKPCAELSALHELHGVACSAFITACNPFSRSLSDEENAERQAALAAELKLRGLVFIEGVGKHPSNQWPGEPSYLVLGLPLHDANALGRDLEQNAIVWSAKDAIPQLILLR